MVRAEAYCTVSNNTEEQYLIELGVPRDRIFHCNSTTLVRDLLEATRGHGGDVVVNLTPELFKTSWQCAAEMGTVIDLSKHDPTSQSSVDSPKGNRMLATVDLARIAEAKPDIIHGLLRRCMHNYALGELDPLPVTRFPAEKIQDAFRCMQQGYIGKIAVVMPEDPSSLPITAARRTPSFRSDGMHIIAGGLGGLGRSISSWMASHGARHFLFFSPSASNKGDDPFLLELRAQGCRIDLISGDVSDEDDVDRLIRCLDQDVSIAGVMQASMALEVVTSFADMTFEQWNKSFAPKVQGTWNLQNALLKHRRSTDYFLLFSSLSGLIGQTGHANYSAGNAFLDALVQYRHSLNFPCSVINIGVMEDVGYVSEQSNVLDHFASTSTHTLLEQDLLDAVQLSIDNSKPPAEAVAEEHGSPSYVNSSQICIGLRSTSPLDSPANRIAWRRDPRMALYHNTNKTNDTGNSLSKDTEHDRALDDFLNAIKSNRKILHDQASADTLGNEVGKALFKLMLHDPSDLNLNIPLTSLGVDSLLAIKMKSWFKQRLDVEIGVVQILGTSSLRELGRMTAQNLAAK